jgi:hypothetical protein
MIVWGGIEADGSKLADGGAYDPLRRTWTPISSASAPGERGAHAAVWTGSVMVVFGGVDSAGTPLDTGGRYDPVTDSWAPTSLVGAPAPRLFPTAVWTGTRLLVWGGEADVLRGDGGAYY